jgi:hypothetical protein
VAAWVAEASARGGGRGAPGVDRLWNWFRDRWGVVWARRVQERFNQSARATGWPIRLGWFGVVPEPGHDLVIPEAAEATLKGLLRRFADAATVEDAAGSRVGGPCQVARPG